MRSGAACAVSVALADAQCDRIAMAAEALQLGRQTGETTYT